MPDKPSAAPVTQAAQSDRTMQIDRSLIDKQLRNVKTTHKKACFVIMGGLDVGSIVEMTTMKMTVG